MNTHTPIPWEYWKMTSGKYGIGRVMRPSNSVDRVSDRIESKEDAKFIVRAVNSHEALMDTLILTLPYIETLADDPGHKPESINNFVKKIHNVLAEAEGKTALDKWYEKGGTVEAEGKI